MVADVAEREGAEQGVAEGVDRHVPVRVGHETHRALDLHAAEPHRQPFPQRMYIVAWSNPVIHNRSGVHKRTEREIKFV